MPLAADLLLRKAVALRTALLSTGTVVSPDASLPFSALPPERQARWLDLAQHYLRIFYHLDSPHS